MHTRSSDHVRYIQPLFATDTTATGVHSFDPDRWNVEISTEGTGFFGEHNGHRTIPSLPDPNGPKPVGTNPYTFPPQQRIDCLSILAQACALMTAMGRRCPSGGKWALAEVMKGAIGEDLIRGPLPLPEALSGENEPAYAFVELCLDALDREDENAVIMSLMTVLRQPSGYARGKAAAVLADDRQAHFLSVATVKDDPVPIDLFDGRARPLLPWALVDYDGNIPDLHIPTVFAFRNIDGVRWTAVRNDGFGVDLMIVGLERRVDTADISMACRFSAVEPDTVYVWNMAEGTLVEGFRNTNVVDAGKEKDLSSVKARWLDTLLSLNASTNED